MEIPGYKILRQLGRGGMATVYLALQESVEREVALKVMSPYLLTDPTFGDRFLREARIAAKMTHRHIVQVHDVGRAGDHHYIAMEYLSEGEVIAKDGHGLDVMSVLKASKEIASALGYAHAKGFIHRDVKPDNILKRDDGAAVLTDFGIARAADSQTHMTQTGSVIGTPHYMSPEQARGRTVDGRADLYSLGVVFHEMLLGRVPFTADDSLAVGIMHITQPVPELPTHLRAFQPVLDRLLAKLPEERFQTGDELVDALEDLEARALGGEFPDLLAPATMTRVRLPAPMARTKPTKSVPTRSGRVEPVFGEIIGTPTAPQRRVDPAPPRRIAGLVVLFGLLLASCLALGWFYREPLLARFAPPPAPLLLQSEPSAEAVPAEPAVPTPSSPAKPFPPAAALLPRITALIAAGTLIGGPDSAFALLESARTLTPAPADLEQALASFAAAAEIAVARSDDETATIALLEAWRALTPQSAALLAVEAKREQARTEAQIAQTFTAHLAAAELARKAGRLLGARSADAELSAAARIKPADPALLAVKKLLALSMLNRANLHLAERELERARALLNRAEILDNRAAGLASAQLKLAALSEEQATAAQPADAAQAAEIAGLLAQANAHMASGELNSPPLDNAFDKFKQVLRIEPKNADALAGLKALPAQFQSLFDRAITANDVVKADEYFGGLSDLGLPPATLGIYRQRLVEAYAEAINKARLEGRETRASNYVQRIRQLAPEDPRGQ